jgi:peroxiredoxin
MTGNSVQFHRTLALSAALSLAFFFSCSRSKTTRAGTDAKDAANLKPAPDFTLQDSNGATVSLADYRGKVVLLNFWATWCGPCKIEIPWFMEFEQQYKNKGFEVLGVSMDDDGWEAVKPYITEKKMNYRVVLGNDSVAKDYGGIDALPTTFVINQDGKIVASHVGLVNKDDYLKEIQNLLESTSTSSIGLRRILIPALLGSGPNR